MGKRAPARANPPTSPWSGQSKAAGLVLLAFLVGKYQQAAADWAGRLLETRVKPAISSAWALAVQNSDFVQLLFAICVGVLPPLYILSSRTIWKRDPSSSAAADDAVASAASASPEKAAASEEAASAKAAPAASAAAPTAEAPAKAAAAASTAQPRQPAVGRPKNQEELEERKRRAAEMRKELENDEDQREIRREIRLSEQRRRRALEEDAPRAEDGGDAAAAAAASAAAGSGEPAPAVEHAAKRAAANEVDDEEEEEEKVHYVFEPDESSRTIEIAGCPNLRVKTSRNVKFLTKSCIFEACYCTKERNPDSKVEWALLWEVDAQKAYCKHLFHASCLVKGIKLWPPNSTGNPCPLCTCLKLFM
eukprot:tig00000227_g19825.t1